MFAIVYSFYALLVLMNLVFYIFIVYHLINYSVNTQFSRIMVYIFTIGSVILIISNITLFSIVDWKIALENAFPNKINFL